MRFATLALLLSVGFACGSVAEPEASPLAATIPISKRTHRFHKANSTRVDFDSFDGHLAHVSGKYSQNMDNYKKAHGKAHPWAAGSRKKPSSSKRRIQQQQLKKRGVGIIGLNNVDSYLWTGTIAFGTPAQSTLVDFDTGSADTILNNNAYRPGSSSTSSRTYKTFRTSYGDGTAASGSIYKDVVTIAGLKASNANIGLSSTNFIDPSAEGGNTGISGLAYQSISAFPAPGFVDTLRSAGVLSAALFAFRLSESGGWLSFGNYPASAISGGITWLGVNPANGFWAVPATISGVGSLTAILDTGTTAIVAPPSAAQTFFRANGMRVRQYNGVYYGAYNCNAPPTVTVTFAGKAITLSRASATLGTDYDGACLSSIVGQDSGIGSAWIMGDALLRNIISIYDKGNNRVGLASIK